jgi:hypothetical protein
MFWSVYSVFCIFYGLFCKFCSHCAIWHPSSILTEVFLSSFLSCKANARV